MRSRQRLSPWEHTLIRRLTGEPAPTREELEAKLGLRFTDEGWAGIEALRPQRPRWWVIVLWSCAAIVVLISLVASSYLLPPRFLAWSLKGQELTAAEQRVKAEKNLRTLLLAQELTAEQHRNAENDLRTLLQGPELTAEQRLKAENDLRTTMLQAVGGFLLLFGAIVTWRQLQVSKKQLQNNLTASQDQQDAYRLELHQEREAHFTERFTKAIDQLDYKKSLEVRLGAIYALERVARESQRDHWPIMEVLTTYVRQHAPWRAKTPLMEAVVAYTRRLRSRKDTPMPNPAPDIQAILTVLGRRRLTYRQGEDLNLDLRGTDLRGARLRRAHLEGAWLDDAHLEGADIYTVHLEAAVLGSAIGLTKEQIMGAITDEMTVLPEDLAPHVRRSDVVIIRNQHQVDTWVTSKSKRAREWLQLHAGEESKGDKGEEGWLVKAAEEGQLLGDEVLRAGLRLQFADGPVPRPAARRRQ